MGYYLRVLAKSTATVPVSRLRQRLEKDGLKVVLECSTDEGSAWTKLLMKHRNGDPIADIERNEVAPGSLAFDELIEFADDIEECKPATAVKWLREFFKTVKAIYAFQILRGADRGKGWDGIWAVEGELWGALGGILQSDNEGFSNEDGYSILWQFEDHVRGPWKMAVLSPDGHWTAFEMNLGNRAHREAFFSGEVPEGVPRL